MLNSCSPFSQRISPLIPIQCSENISRHPVPINLSRPRPFRNHDWLISVGPFPFVMLPLRSEFFQVRIRKPANNRGVRNPSPIQPTSCLSVVLLMSVTLILNDTLGTHITLQGNLGHTPLTGPDASTLLEFWDRRCPSVLDLRAARAGSPSKSHRGAEATSLIRLLIGS